MTLVIDWTGQRSVDKIPDTDAPAYQRANWLLQALVNKQDLVAEQLEASSIYETLAPYWIDPIAVLFKQSLDNSVDPEWKQYDGVLPDIFRHCFFKIQVMGSLLRRSFPVILGMAAHHVRGAKVVGMQCMKRLVDLVSPSELTKCGYHEALFESLKALFVFPEHTEDAFEIMLSLINKCEAPLSPSFVAKCDYLLHFVMREVASERGILIRLQQLALIVDALDVYCIRFLKSIVLLLLDLAESRGGGIDASKEALEVMRALFKHAHPRLPVYRLEVARILDAFRDADLTASLNKLNAA